MKTPFQSEPMWFGLGGVLLYKPSILATFQGRFSFYSFGLKREKLRILEIKLSKPNKSEPVSLFNYFNFPFCFKANSVSLCSGVLYFICSARFVRAN